MIWRAIGVFAAIAVLGALAGHVATAPDEAPARTVHVGAATLTLAGEWRASGPATFTDGRRRMRVMFGPSTPARGVVTRLAGYDAWSYGAVTVLPTTRGALTVMCGCASAIRSVSVAEGAILAPAPDLALRLRAPGVLATLDAARARTRATWTDRSAQHLAAAHHTALAALRSVVDAPAGESFDALRVSAGSGATVDAALAEGRRADGSTADGQALLLALSNAGGAYDRLATTSAARGDVIAADRAVDAAVATLARDGAPAVQRPPVPVTAPSGGASPLTLLLVAVFALLVSAVAPAAVRRARNGRGAPGDRELGAPTHAEPDVAAKACRLAPRRRTPIAPPPTYGRWNETPRGPGAAVATDDARQRATASSSTT